MKDRNNVNTANILAEAEKVFTDLFINPFLALMFKADDRVDDQAEEECPACEEESCDSCEAEASESSKAFRFVYTRNDLADDVEKYAIFMADTLDYHTFRAIMGGHCTYDIRFTFGDVVYVYSWNLDTLHFDGYIEGAPSDTFWYNECERQFIRYSTDQTYTAPVNEEDEPCDECKVEVEEPESDEDNLNPCCGHDGPCPACGEDPCQCDPCECIVEEQEDGGCKCNDEERCCRVHCDDPDSMKGADCRETEADIPVTSSRILYESLNRQRNSDIKDMLPYITKGLDRIFSYNMYEAYRSSENSPIDTVTFTLEDVALVAPDKISKFWDMIEYTTIVDIIKKRYEFPRVFILDKLLKNGGVAHEVRCTLK